MDKIIILILVLYIILRDSGIRLPRFKKAEPPEEADLKDIQEREKEFNHIMTYSIDEAIKSKRSD